MLKRTGFANAVSDSLGRLFAWLPLHPNTITILSVVLAVLGYVTWLPGLEQKVESMLLFAFAFFFDAIDGAVARAKKLDSKQGAFLDGVADRVVEFFLVLVLFKIYAFNIEMTALFFFILFFGTAMTSFVKAYAEHQGMLKHEEAVALPGIFERTERSIALLAVFFLSNVENYAIARPLLYVTAGLCVLTFLERFWYVYTKK